MAEERISRNEAAERVVRLVNDLGLQPVALDDFPEEIGEDDLGVVCWMVVLPQTDASAQDPHPRVGSPCNVKANESDLAYPCKLATSAPSSKTGLVMAAALLAIGVVSEFAGIVLLGFPDFVPGAIRLSGWLGRHGRRAANWLRRLVGRSPRGVVHTAGSGGVIVTGGSVTGVVSTNATTLEGKVDYLMRRDQDAQHMFDALAERVNRLEADSPRQLDEVRREMEGHVARELTAALEAYRPLRVAGTILLAVGLGSVTAAALLA